MQRVLAVIALTLFGLTGFGDEPDLVEGAKQATAYCHSTFGSCGKAWYAVIPDGSIQMASELHIHFKTEQLSLEQRLNGFEFKATTSIEPGSFRWWIAQKKAWREWQVGEMAPAVVLIKKKGVWSKEPAPSRTQDDRKALTTCSQIPPTEAEKR